MVMQNQADSTLVVLALLAVTGFMVWLVFFTGEGYKGIWEDIKSARGIKKERFPVPIFDRSKIDLPRPKKPKLQAITREPINFNEQQLRDWASQLQQSIKDIRKEATELAKAYNAMPPSLVEDPSKPKRKGKPAAKKTTKKPVAKKTAKKPVKKAAPKRATAVKAKKKTTPKRKGR
jgi:adenylate kinase